MKKIIIALISVLALVIIIPMIIRAIAADPTIYLRSAWNSASLNETGYRVMNSTAGTSVDTGTSVSVAKTSNTSFIVRPGIASSALAGLVNGSTPYGKGWKTDYNETGTISAGTWTFGIETQASGTSTGGPITNRINVFKNCSGTNTRLFDVNGTTSLAASASAINELISTSQPEFNIGGDCFLKAEYWFVVGITKTGTARVITFRHELSTSNVSYPTVYNKLTSVSLDDPTSNLNVNVGSTFDMNSTPTTDDSTRGINLTYEYNYTGQSDFVAIPSASGGLTISGSNPQVNARNNNMYNRTITVNTADTYYLRTRLNNASDSVNSTLIVVTVDNIPPTWTNAQQNVSNPHRGEYVNLSAVWQDTGVGLSKAWLQTNETGANKNYTDGTYGSPSSLSGTSPVTVNFTWMNSTGNPRVIGWVIFANDTVNNVNGTKNPSGVFLGNFTMYGWSNITWSSPTSGSSFDANSVVQLVAFVNDTNVTGSGPIQNYPVSFYWKNSTGEALLGANLTNSTGHAIWNWNTGGLGSGTYYPKANITNNASLFYDASGFNQANTTVGLTTTNQVNAALSFSLSDLSSNSGTRTKISNAALSMSGISLKSSSLFKSLGLPFSLKSAFLKSATSFKLPLAGFSLQTVSSSTLGLLKSITSSFSLSSLSGKLSDLYKSLSLPINMRSISGKISSVYKSLTGSISIQALSSKFTGFYKSLQQNISTNAITTKVISFFKGISQNLQLTSISAKLMSIIKLPTQSLSLSLAAIRSQLFTARVISSFSMSDLAAGIRTIAFKTYDRIASLAVSMTGSMTRILDSIRASLTGFSLNAMSSKLILNVRSITGNLSLSGLAESTKAFVRSLSQSLSLSSITAKFYIIQKTITASISLQGMSARFGTIYKSLQQGFSTNAITGKTISFFRGISQSLQLNSITARVLSLIRVPSQSLSVSLAAIRSQLFTARVLSAFNLSGLASGIKAVGVLTLNRAASLTISVTGNMARMLNSIRTLSQAVTANAITGRITSFFRTIAIRLSILFGLSKQQLKANSQSCSVNYECYSGLCCSGVCQSVCPTVITPSGGAGGGGGGFALNITPLPTVNVEFSKMPVLREIAPGQSAIVGINIKNKGNASLTGLHIEVTGIPKEWLTIVPSSLDLGQSGTGEFSIGISVPDTVTFGDYKGVVTLKNQITEDSSFFILRVKSRAVQDDKPFVVRTVEIDRLEGKTNVELNVYNPASYWRNGELIEYIPKEIANSTDLIEFNTTPSEIIQKDPIVSWKINDLVASDTRKISYSTSNILGDLTPYIYWPLRELSLEKSKPISSLEIVDLSVPRLYPGRSSIATLSIRNLDNSSHIFGFDIRLPSEWKTEPNNITEVIKGMEKKDFMFSIIVPDKTSPGYYVARGEFLWDDGIIVKEYNVGVSSFVYWNITILVFASILIIVVIAIFYTYMKRRKLEMYFNKLKEQHENV